MPEMEKGEYRAEATSGGRNAGGSGRRARDEELSIGRRRQTGAGRGGGVGKVEVGGGDEPAREDSGGAGR